MKDELSIEIYCARNVQYGFDQLYAKNSSLWYIMRNNGFEVDPIGETIIGNRFETRFGGKGANQAVMISKLVDATQEVVFVSKVGEDSFGKDMKSELDQYQLNTKYVSTTNQCSSGIC